MTNPMFEGRTLRAAALAAAKSTRPRGGGWMKNLKKCMECFGWCTWNKGELWDSRLV